jgi:hypothetical protein
VLSYTDDDVINNQRYYYQVSAENSAGEGEMSDEKFATLIPGITVPSAPQDLEATPNDGYVSLEWFPPRDGFHQEMTAVLQYQITTSIVVRHREEKYF